MLTFFSAANGLQSGIGGLLAVNENTASYDVELPLYFGFNGTEPWESASSWGHAEFDGYSYSTMIGLDILANSINPQYSAILPPSAYTVTVDNRVMLNNSAFSEMRVVAESMYHSGTTAATAQYSVNWAGSRSYVHFNGGGWSAAGKPYSVFQSPYFTGSASGVNEGWVNVAVGDDCIPVDYGSYGHTAKVNATSIWTPANGQGIVAMFSGNLKH